MPSTAIIMLGQLLTIYAAVCMCTVFRILPILWIFVNLLIKLNLLKYMAKAVWVIGRYTYYWIRGNPDPVEHSITAE